MPKKTNLSAALHQASQLQNRSISTDNPIDSTMKTDTRENVVPVNVVPPSRRGKKLIGGHFDPTVSYQLKRLALDQETSVQQLLREAINDLFRKYDLPSIV